MRCFKVIKSLNANAVLVTYDNIEYILIDKGIGFNKKANDLIADNGSIKDVYITESKLNNQSYKKIMENIDDNLMSVVMDSVHMAEDILKEKLDGKIYFSLADHLLFGITRMENGLDIKNPFDLETKMLYPKEYDVALKTVRLLNARLKVEFPLAEAGFIALHIHGARQDSNKERALQEVKIVKMIIPYLKDKVNINFEDGDFDSMRLVTHLKGMIDRCTRGEYLNNILLTEVKDKMKFEYNISKNIALILQKELDIIIPDDEIGYIALHLYKINNKHK